MKFLITIFLISLLQASTLAGPLVSGGQALAEALASSEQKGHLKSQSGHLKPQTNHLNSQTQARRLPSLNARAVDFYEVNWAGAYLNGSGYNAVTAEFTIPRIKLPLDARPNWQYCASAWIGLDGLGCPGGGLQAGVSFCLNGTKVSYNVWSDWDHRHNMDDLSLVVGDIVKLTVNTTTPTTGTAVVENLTNGKVTAHEFAGENTRGSLCRSYAEWIVEDYLEDSFLLVPFVDFGITIFSGAQANTTDGRSVGPSDATTLDMQQGPSEILTSSSVTKDSVAIKYVG
ncbi:hypothetical protein N7541_008161 [Penicillium brevicompactum]|uniref:Aspergillopepsin-2 n=1 Tax=Penicillium brevicompactum TaxID=5074 RepID=A0A9W9R1J0_PENBR|nr:hypothetical protein N7541_008161 [Penicillium brevicompactum]